MKNKFISGIKSKLSTLKTIILLLVLISLAISLTRNIMQTKNAQQSIEEAQKNLSQLKKENQELQNALEYTKSQAYFEAQARNKLGLAKEGEIILVLPEEEVLKRLSPRGDENEKPQIPDPNWKMWLKLFI